MSYYNDKRKMLQAIGDYLQQEKLEPWSVFVRRTGFNFGFDIPTVTRMLEKNFAPLTVEDDQVVNSRKLKGGGAK